MSKVSIRAPRAGRNFVRPVELAIFDSFNPRPASGAKFAGAFLAITHHRSFQSAPRERGEIRVMQVVLLRV